MLKIYLKTVIHEVHSDSAEYEIYHRSFYTIEEESVAKAHTRECNIYHDEINNISHHIDLYDVKRGRIAYVYGSDCFLKFKQWKEPNAKLVERVTYRDYACSMRELCTLPADKVIAYLKQEGLNVTMPS